MSFPKPNDLISPEDFRSAIGAYCSGITVISAKAPDGKLHGMTCQSFHSLSLDPPLIAYFAGNTSKSYAELSILEHFTVNVLAQGQENIAMRFAKSGADKWSETDYELDALGQPILSGVIATISCRRHEIYPGGDHAIHVGLVSAIRHAPELTPLLFFRSRFAKIEKANL